MWLLTALPTPLRHAHPSPECGCEQGEVCMSRKVRAGSSGLLSGTVGPRAGPMAPLHDSPAALSLLCGSRPWPSVPPSELCLQSNTLNVYQLKWLPCLQEATEPVGSGFRAQLQKTASGEHFPRGKTLLKLPLDT